MERWLFHCHETRNSRHSRLGLVGVVHEIFLVNTPAAATAVNKGNIAGIRQAMETGKAQGMCFLNDTLTALLAEKKISAETHRLAIRKE